MDTNIVTPAEDAEMADCDGEEVVTMMDILREQEDIENDANAVLGASDEKNCTYSKGYIKRQAIYACITCCPQAKDDPSKRAGVCLACSLTCHENHDLIELYTKRNFRCDCGNPKFNSHPCQYTPTKTDLNENNEYNQNFSGLYCVCNRPYPDPDNKIDDEMIQCIICEDWLHASHLEATLPPNEQYSEMICKGCMEKNLFLHDYSHLAVNVENDFVDVVNLNIESTTVSNDIKEYQVETLKDGIAVLEKPDDLEKKDGNFNNDGDTQEITKSSAIDTIENTLPVPENNCMLKSNDAINNVPVPQDMPESVDISETITNVDAETMEEDRLLADPDESASQSRDDESIEKQENEKNKNSNISTEKTIQNEEKLKDTILDGPGKDNIEKPELLGSDVENEKLQSLENNKISEDKDNIEKPELLLSDVGNEKLQSLENNKISEDKDNIEKPELLGSDVENEKLQSLENNKTSEESDHNALALSQEQLAGKDTMQGDPEENNEKEKSACSLQDPNVTNQEEKDKKELEKGESIETKMNIHNNADDKTSENKRKISEENENTIEDSDVEKKRIKLDCTNCTRPRSIKKKYKGATFWPSDFRQKLCTCNECLTMYKDLSVLFLIDLDDTVRAYESLGEEKERIEGKPASQYEKGLQALSSLDRIQQINALTEYNKMRDKLLEFLKSFKDRKEVVKAEDIKEFFAHIKPKREPDGVYFCR